MKTLLLTLVVVTIVCLDLGNTRICDDSNIPSERTPKRCQGGYNICYKINFPTPGYELLQIKGCAARCPTNPRFPKAECCATDNCI
uniref:Three-finger toxin MALT0044C n=1 Tax=Micrurus altirostris TaxID=129457 RepID=3SX4_MICAT|nr:RecName: Full=Three-finger toxin MALT0044C; Short=3FTx MALT0044C; Flags: Precursor [Micrurus altirostris]AED89560.1 putative three finger toxin precursor [Micrurus altirostris]